jgi:hypothetical protein
MQQIERKPLFDLGQLVATPGALAALEKSGQTPMDFLSRHGTGDWGELSEDDHKRRDVPRLTGNQERQDVAHERHGNRGQNHGRLRCRIER